MSNGSLNLVVGGTNQQDFRLDGARRDRKKAGLLLLLFCLLRALTWTVSPVAALLPPACSDLDCFSSVMPLSHATQSGSQVNMD